MKSSHSNRTVPIDSYTAGAIQEWIAVKRGMLRDQCILPKNDLPLIFNHNNPSTYDGFTKKWRKIADKIGLEGVRFYALRHTFATLNLARGENIKTISQIMGHANASYTLDLYVGYVP